MGAVRGLGTASSASSSSTSASQNGLRSRISRRLRNKPRRTNFQTVCFFDRPRTSEFSFFKRFQRCLPDQHTPERTVSSRSCKDDGPIPEHDSDSESFPDHEKFPSRRPRNSRSCNEDDHPKQSGTSHVREKNDGVSTATNDEDGAIYMADYKNIFKRIQLHLRELASRSSKEAGHLSIETLSRRLEVVESTDRENDKWSSDFPETAMRADWKAGGSMSLLEDEQELHYEHLEGWNPEEIAWSSRFWDGNNADCHRHNEQFEEDDDPDFRAIKNWNIEEMMKSAYGSEQLPKVDTDFSAIRNMTIPKVESVFPTLSIGEMRKSAKLPQVDLPPLFFEQSLDLVGRGELFPVLEKDPQFAGDEVSDNDILMRRLPSVAFSDSQAEAHETDADSISKTFGMPQQDSLNFEPEDAFKFDIAPFGLPSQDQTDGGVGMLQDSMLSSPEEEPYEAKASCSTHLDDASQREEGKYDLHSFELSLQVRKDTFPMLQDEEDFDFELAKNPFRLHLQEVKNNASNRRHSNRWSPELSIF